MAWSTTFLSLILGSPFCLFREMFLSVKTLFTLFFIDATKQKAFCFPAFFAILLGNFWRPFLFYPHNTHKTVPISHTDVMTLPTLLWVEQVNLAENCKQSAGTTHATHLYRLIVVHYLWKLVHMLLIFLAVLFKSCIQFQRMTASVTAALQDRGFEWCNRYSTFI